MKNKLVFVIHSLSQPRCIKRVLSLRQAGFECVVYGYNRGNYDVNAFPDDIPVNVLGVMQNGSNGDNLRTAKRNFDRIIKENGKDCIYYTFGFLASFLISFRRVPFIYEISDVQYAYPKYDKVRFLLKMLDKRIIRKARYVVMTSGGFQKFYGLSGDKVILMPNKVSPLLKDVPRQTIDVSQPKLRFAFVGSIRYDAIFRFAQTIGERFPGYEFHFYGGAPEKTLKRVGALTDRFSNIFLHGPFKSPEDLPGIYNEAHIIVACYDTNSLNERIAEPNKLYEAILFCRPLVVSVDTYLAQRVAEYGCGYAIDPSSVDSIASFVESLTTDALKAVSERERLVDVKEITNDATLLVDALSKITTDD